MSGVADLDRLEPASARRPAECPVEDWLAFLGHRWNALIPWHLKDGPRRYGELARLLPGASPKILSERLAGLVARGIVARHSTSTYPRRVAYRLSAKGRDLVAIIDEIELWDRRARAA